MKRLNGYQDAQAFTEGGAKLPVGGYIIQIYEVTEVDMGYSSVLQIKFDIAEGEHKNFFQYQYQNSQLEDKKFKGVHRLNIPADDGSEKDELTMRIFKSSMVAIEESNPGYHWDWNEKNLEGKFVGAIFFEKEYDFNGRTGFFTTLHSFRSVQAIKDGKFKIPAPKLLAKKDNARLLDDAPMLSDSDLPF